VLLAGLVVMGVKHITKIAPFFLIPVLLSVFFIQIGIYSATDDGNGGITGMSRKTLADNWAPDFVITDAQGVPDPTGGTTWNFQVWMGNGGPAANLVGFGGKVVVGVPSPVCLVHAELAPVPRSTLHPTRTDAHCYP
jgi:hypothetical protein